jgi:thiol-disulfide isomerase/thioredoxin
MNKRILTISGLILVLVGLAIAYVIVSSDTDTTTTVNQTSEDTSLSMPTASATPAPDNTPPSKTVKGLYTDYTEEKVASTSGTKVLFFHAPWCSQCRALENDIEASEIPDNVTIFKVDYDSNQKLRQEYGVTIQTTLVLIDDEGALQKKYVAYDNPTLESVKRNLLN